MLQVWPFIFFQIMNVLKTSSSKPGILQLLFPDAHDPSYLKSAQLQTEQSLRYRGLTC